MTEQQIGWASSHDWFLSVTLDGLGVLVIDASVLGGQLHQETRTFSDYRALRRWANY